MSHQLRRSSTKIPSKLKDYQFSAEDSTCRNTNIKVIARFRPLIQIEKTLPNENDLQYTFPSNTSVVVPSSIPETFFCDWVFPSSSSQEEVYNISGRSMITDVLEGYNGTVFAYGQTGSGKTHTMLGDILNPQSRGIIPRSISQIFQFASNSPQIEFTLKCSMLEIYKETLRDLLGFPESLKIKECIRKGIYVQGLTELYVSSEQEVIEALLTGEKSRTVGSTKLNQMSSRSHQLFMLEIREKFEDETEKKGVLNLIDLAGSEKIKDAGVSGNNLEEAKKINLSLSCLGNVIHALTTFSEHVPYRDSKLTRLLQESLAGNFKTSLIITCSPALRNLEETVNTLRFAQRAKKVKTSAKINFRSIPENYLKLIESLKKQLSDAKIQIKNLQSLDSSPILLSPIHKKETNKSECCIQLFTMEDNSITTEDVFNKTSKTGKSESSKIEELNQSILDLKSEKKELEWKLKSLQDKIITSEEKSHEYYEMYHKLLLEVKSSEFAKRKIEKQNIHLKNQLEILSRHLTKLERTIILKNENKSFCEFEINKWKHSFIINTEDSDEDISQEPSDKFINLPIDVDLLKSSNEYSSALRSKLTTNSEIDINHTVLNLKNQVVQAEILNNDLILAINSLSCKHLLLKEKLKIKSLSLKLQSDRIGLLEDILNHIHQSYSKIIKYYRKSETPVLQTAENGKFAKPVSRKHSILSLFQGHETHAQPFRESEIESQLFIHRQINQELQLGIEIARTELKCYKETMTKITEQLHISHENHQKKVKMMLFEYKKQCQIELQRRQEEISKLHDVIAHWINQFMQLQETSGIPSSRGTHRRSLSRQYVEMIKKLCEKTSSVTQGQVQPVFKSILKINGDHSPALYEDI